MSYHYVIINNYIIFLNKKKVHFIKKYIIYKNIYKKKYKLRNVLFLKYTGHYFF